MEWAELFHLDARDDTSSFDQVDKGRSVIRLLVESLVEQDYLHNCPSMILRDNSIDSFFFTGADVKCKKTHAIVGQANFHYKEE